MCRRCGEPDKRPSAKRRRQLTRRLLEIHGNGVVCPCFWCGDLLGAVAGYLAVPATRSRIRVHKLERDRLTPGGTYALYNLVPSCGPCNRIRDYETRVIPDGCEFGPGLPVEPAL